ncbi:LysR family transcriptional regulator [Staphylococcus kloosii]|nr:LysR family transcriptional regulator [Staphylococcus kloosii]
MELKQLEYFIALCEKMHFTRAAEKLNIAQPSLSQQINLLEHEIGAVLFERTGKRNILTETGQILLEHSYNIFSELSKVRLEINRLQNLKRGQLKIGSILTVIDHLLAPTAVKFFIISCYKKRIFDFMPFFNKKTYKCENDSNK